MGADLPTLRRLVHGTMVATNAIIDRRGAVTGFVTTEGAAGIRLPAGCELSGPSAVERLEATVWTSADARATLDGDGNLILRLPGTLSARAQPDCYRI